MSDKKISELTQLTSANAITDVLPVVDSSLDKTDKITAAKFPISASAIARAYPYTRDFISDNEQTRDLSSIDNTHGYYSNSNLTSIYIGSHVTSISSSAFYNATNLTNVIISNGTTSISDHAFSSCTSLASITLPTNSLITIGATAFINSGLTSITIPDSVTSIGNFAFSGCTSLATISCLATTAPTLVGSSHFSGVTATTITVPKNTTQSYKDAGDGTLYGGLTIVEA